MGIGAFIFNTKVAKLGEGHEEVLVKSFVDRSGKTTDGCFNDSTPIPEGARKRFSQSAQRTQRAYGRGHQLPSRAMLFQSSCVTCSMT